MFYVEAVPSARSLFVMDEERVGHWVTSDYLFTGRISKRGKNYPALILHNFCYIV